jgi:hypothetical protein
MSVTDIANSGFVVESNSSIEVLLENQRRLNQMTENDTADIASFTRISIPLIRRVYPTLPPASAVTCTLDWLHERGIKRVNWQKEGF